MLGTARAQHIGRLTDGSLGGATSNGSVRKVTATPTNRLQAARELRGFLRGGLTVATPSAAAAVLDGLRAVLPYDCAALSLWDPCAAHHVTLAGDGYPNSVLRFLDTRMQADPIFAEIRRGRTPVRVRDIPLPRRRGEVFETIIRPLGFADGVTHCLVARDGRYLGMLNASTVSSRQPDDDAVALLDLLADDLAAALDPLPLSVPPSAVLAKGEADGILVCSAGQLIPLTTGARPELAEASSPLRPLLEAMLARPASQARLVVLLGLDLLAVTLDGGPEGVLLLHRPGAAPYGLTPRELQVLDAVSRGWTNAVTAQALGVAPRTVGTHIEHVLAKTQCPNRTAAARLAARLGLLTDVRP